MPWNPESRRRYYNKSYKSSKLEARKKQAKTLTCNICGRKFRLRKNQDARYTRFCSVCRNGNMLRDAAIFERGRA